MKILKLLDSTGKLILSCVREDFDQQEIDLFATTVIGDDGLPPQQIVLEVLVEN